MVQVIEKINELILAVFVLVILGLGITLHFAQRARVRAEIEIGRLQSEAALRPHEEKIDALDDEIADKRREHEADYDAFARADAEP